MNRRPGPFHDPWQWLRGKTPARIALGRAGGSRLTQELLAFRQAHAAAVDAVGAPFLVNEVVAKLGNDGLTSLVLETEASDHATYLRRPDLGRRLSPQSAARLASKLQVNGPPLDVVVIIADGLSARAANRHGASLAAALTSRFRALHLSVAPIVILKFGRVAAQDEIGLALGARLALTLIGERPGLQSADSIGAYLVINPKPGRSDAERNCVANIRPDGLPLDAAVHKLSWLVTEALRRGISGVGLKDEAETLSAATIAVPPPSN